MEQCGYEMPADDGASDSEEGVDEPSAEPTP